MKKTTKQCKKCKCKFEGEYSHYQTHKYVCQQCYQELKNKRVGNKPTYKEIHQMAKSLITMPYSSNRGYF